MKAQQSHVDWQVKGEHEQHTLSGYQHTDVDSNSLFTSKQKGHM